MTSGKPLLEMTAEDVMVRDVVTIPQETTLQEAANVLYREGVSGAAVVDELGRCVGVISASDFVRWAAGTASEVPRARSRTCPYRMKGHRESGWEGWICVLGQGGCPFQGSQPTLGGRHVSVCLRPATAFNDWQQLTQALPADAVGRYATAGVVTVEPHVRLAELARKMLDEGVHRLYVIDGSGRPVGVVSSTALLAALAAESPQATQDGRRAECVAAAPAEAGTV